MPLTRSLCGKQTRRQVLLPRPPTKLPLATVIHTPTNSTLRKSDTLENYNNHKFYIGYGQAISGSDAFGFQQEKHLGRAVSRILSARVAPRRGPFICCSLTRGLNRFRFGGGPPRALYLALHPMGFAVPPRLRSARWALTPPFHPYPGRSRGGIFSVALSVNPPSRVSCPSVSPAEPELRGIVSCGVRTFLSRQLPKAILHPSKVETG